MITDFIRNWEDGYKIVIGVKEKSEESSGRLSVDGKTSRSQRIRHLPNSLGSARAKTRPNVSWDGMTFGNFRDLPHKASLPLAKLATSTQSSAPPSLAQKVNTNLSVRHLATNNHPKHGFNSHSRADGNPGKIGSSPGFPLEACANDGHLLGHCILAMYLSLWRVLSNIRGSANSENFSMSQLPAPLAMCHPPWNIIHQGSPAHSQSEVRYFYMQSPGGPVISPSQRR